jgi:hypothetical protein
MRELLGHVVVRRRPQGLETLAGVLDRHGAETSCKIANEYARPGEEFVVGSLWVGDES